MQNQPLACPWKGCTFVAADVGERNRHVLEECPQRATTAAYAAT